jgi:hypothetical protein
MVLIEADPAGGTLAAAGGMALEPSLVTLAAAARHDSDPELIWDHCQELPNAQSVLLGAAASTQAASALRMLASLLDRLDELSVDVVLDFGRTTDPSIYPSGTKLARRIVVTRPHLPYLLALAAWQEVQPSTAPASDVVLIGDGPYPPDEIEQTLGVRVLAQMPWDAQPVSLLTSLPATDRRLRTTPLVRSARTLAELLSSPTLELAANQESESEPMDATPIDHGRRGRLKLVRSSRREREQVTSASSEPGEVHR